MAWQRSFRPLTGMVLRATEKYPGRKVFSPPYGDGTRIVYVNGEQVGLSPPYGDGTTLLLPYRTVSWFFALLRGWYARV